ncbi:phage holin family protein [Erwinia sp. CGal63]|uniref:phage holin family protein n=1 Tax=Erwinia sp. CGal63 TaxID=2919889 RepID=UPI003009C83C
MKTDLLSLIDAAICVAIALRIMLFYKADKTYKKAISWIAAGLILFYSNFALLWLFGYYQSSWPMALFNLLSGIVVFAVRGNVAKLMAFAIRGKQV